MTMTMRLTMLAAALLAVHMMAPLPGTAQPANTTPPAEPAAGARESTPRFRAGIIGGGTLNIHNGAFTTYDGILECGVFDHATTPGWTAGYLLDVPLGNRFGISGRVQYWKANGDFTSPEAFTARVAIDDQTTVPLTTQQSLETSLDYVTLDMLARWNITAGGLFVAAGPSVGLATRAAYEQEERIVSPNGITFLGGGTERNIIAGNFDEQGTLNTQRELRIAATAVLGYEIPITDRFTLAPEVGFGFGLGNVLSSFDWKVSALRAGASLMYAFGGERPADTVQAPPRPTPVLALDARNQLADGTRLNYAQITLREERGTDVIPLLPYVFFEPNGSSLPQRYRMLAPAATTEFSEATLPDSVLPVYHHVLNIIGSRMRAYTDATITVTGCREPLDDTAPEANEALSVARATEVKNYLVNTWGIAPGRIAVAARVLPQAVSVRNVTDGREENRRAEIRSADARILAPVTRRATAATADPAAVAVLSGIQFGDAIASWRMRLVAPNGTTVSERSGSGEPPAEMLWRVDPSALEHANTGTAMTAVLEATAANGQALRAERAIPIRREIVSRRFNGEVVRDSLIERYNLIFFDFDTPRISDFNIPVVATIQSRIRTNSAVAITGLTDRVGDEHHNDALSAARATSVGSTITQRIVPNRLDTHGAGERLIYENDLPEGRMYNRTVIIEIATPIQEQQP